MNILICIPTTQSLPERTWWEKRAWWSRLGKDPPCLLSITSHRSQISWPWETRHSFTFLCSAKTMGPLVNQKKNPMKRTNGELSHTMNVIHILSSQHTWMDAYIMPGTVRSTWPHNGQGTTLPPRKAQMSREDRCSLSRP